MTAAGVVGTADHIWREFDKLSGQLETLGGRTFSYAEDAKHDYRLTAESFANLCFDTITQRDELLAALQQWACPKCGAHALRDPSPDCATCNGSGLHPIARAAIAKAQGDAA